MSQNLTISKMGLKLIKAYEGYRPVDREVVSGQRVVGYGRRLYNDAPVQMNKAEAEAALRSDLAPFEDMINHQVHAPLLQSQFDALCSLAYNIGPKAFLKSDTLRALNNGRPLDAASGFDIWRKSEIDGKTYVVDALVRRRTAEKALFLRDPNVANITPASRVDLPPMRDEMAALMEAGDGLPVFTRADANGIVATAPYEARVPEFTDRRREDGPAGVLELSEVDMIDAPFADDEIEARETPLAAASPEIKTGVIAEATSDLVGRLDALIDSGEAEEDELPWKAETRESDMSETGRNESLITAADEEVAETKTTSGADIIALNPAPRTLTPPKTVAADKPPVAIIDDLAADDIIRESRSKGADSATEAGASYNSAAKYIERSEAERLPPREAGWGYFLPLLTGFALAGASAAAMVKGSAKLMGEWGPILAFSGLVVGGVMILASILYVLRANFSD